MQVNQSTTLKNFLRTAPFFLLLILGLMSSKVVFGQESFDGVNSLRQYYYNNLESATVGTANPATYFPNSVSTQNNTGIKMVSNSSLNGTKSLSTSGSTTLVGTVTWNFLKNNTTAAATSLNSAPWEWEFDYKNVTGGATIDPDAVSASMVAGVDSWRYWLISSLSGTTKMGIYVTQVNGKLEGRQRFGTIANQYRVLWQVNMPNNNHTYQIRIVRAVTGYFNVFVYDRNDLTTVKSLNINANYDNTYNLSYLDASSATADRFQWDNFNFYQVRLDYLPVTGNGVSSQLYPGMGTAILYGMDLCARGDILMGRFVMTYNSDLQKIIGINVPGYLWEKSTLPLSTTGLSYLKQYTLQNNGRSTQEDLSSLNLQYYSPGASDGTPVHVTYFFLTANVLSTFGTPYPTAINFAVSTSNDDNYSQFFQSTSPYSSSSASSVSPPTAGGDLWEWTGATGATWGSTGAWKKNKQLTTSAVSPTTSTDLIKIGVSQYTGSVQPTLTADVSVASLEIGNLGGTSTSTAPVTINFAGKKITVSNGFSVAANATLVLENNSSTVGNLTISGTSTIASTGSIKWPTASNRGVVLTNNGTLTLLSDANGSASIQAMTATSALNGTVKVQRFITGGSLTYRGYRLLSSPVHSGTTAYYDLGYLKGSGTYLTGQAGGGWDQTGNPTLYLYRPDRKPSNVSFTAGNFRAITAINNSPAYSVGTSDGNFNLGIGNGFMFFYRGNNGTLTTTLPKSLALTSSGTLNQGSITVTPWFKPDTANLDYVAVSGNANVRGFNLVGNPYPSTIDWDTKGTAANSGIYTNNVGDAIYILDPQTQGFKTYLKGGASTLRISRYIASGQGFFVQATGFGAQLTFRESAKVSNQLTSPDNLLLNNIVATSPDRYIRLQLYKSESINDDLYIGFKPTANPAYVFNEDAPYKQGSAKVSLASLSSDKLPMAINITTLPSNKQVIPLSFAVSTPDTYKLNTVEIANVPELYDVWLLDNLTKDSLDIRNNKEYNFATSTDTTTYGANRFKVVLRLNPDKVVRLLSFGGKKADKTVSITWTAENEYSYTRYALERSVDGGKTYQVLDTLTSIGQGTYNDLDPYPVKGLNQYRLKQTDVLGNVSYSAVVNVMYSPTASTTATSIANNLINIYPNPVRNTVNLAITPISKTAASYKVTITNSSGLVVQSATTADVNWQGDVNNLLPGTYFVQVINAKDNTVTGKSTFIKL